MHNSVALQQQVRASLGAWLQEGGSVRAHQALCRTLSAIADLADSRGDPTVRGVADGINQMLDMFAAKSGRLSEQALGTLRHSVEILAGWCEHHDADEDAGGAMPQRGAAQLDANGPGGGVTDPRAIREFITDALTQLRAIRLSTQHIAAETGLGVDLQCLEPALAQLRLHAGSLEFASMAEACRQVERSLELKRQRGHALGSTDLSHLRQLHGLIARALDALLRDGTLAGTPDTEFDRFAEAVAAYAEDPPERATEEIGALPHDAVPEPANDEDGEADGAGDAARCAAAADAESLPAPLAESPPLEAEQAPPLLSADGLPCEATGFVSASLAGLGPVPLSHRLSHLRDVLDTAAHAQGKSAVLDLDADVEIDEALLGGAMAPLESLLRCAVAAIEPASQRTSLGKPASARLTLGGRTTGRQLHIECRHDGAGLDVAAMHSKAMKAGLIPRQATIGPEDLVRLLLTPGVGSASMAGWPEGAAFRAALGAALEDIETLGGSLGLVGRDRGEQGIEVVLPAQLPLLHGMLVRLGAQHYLLPAAAVREVIAPATAGVERSEPDDEPWIRYREQRHPMLDLFRELELERPGADPDREAIVIVALDGVEIGVAVDEVLGRRDVVFQPLQPPVADLVGVAGAACVNGAGLALIIDVGALWERHHPRASLTSGAAEGEEASHDAPQSGVIMVVDDSLTVRKVTGRSLRKHGLEVVLAKDGVDAIEKLRENRPDVMLVDIEMPRMDGYELTRRIRSDPLTRTIPIVIITSRSGTRLRDKAMQLGAEAFLSKPYGEEDLIETVRQMLAASALACGHSRAGVDH